MDSSYIQAFRFKTDGTLTFVNSGYCLAHDTTAKEAIGKKWQDFCCSTEKEHYEKEYTNLINTHNVHTCEHYCCRKGTPCWTLVTVTPLASAEGKIEEFSVIGIDVTEKISREERNKNIQRLESVGLLAGGIAHDFNNLLMGLYGYIDMVRINASDPKRVIHYIDKSLSVFDVAKDLTKRLLTFSKGGAPNRKPTRLTEIITETTELSLNGSNIAPKFIFPANLWKVNADGNQLRQVISNIVINARQAMPIGGVVTIKVNNIPIGSAIDKHLKDFSYVEVVISDEGHGIPQKVISRIFDPYYTTKSGGTGLGLSVVYSIIQRHEGHIAVESTSGKGSIFRIYLPSIEDNISNIEDSESIETTWNGSGRVLIMDDEIAIREIIKEFLESSGYQVTAVESGTAALRCINSSLSENKPYDIMFLDLTVPGDFGGDELLRKIGNKLGATKVVAMSGYANNSAITNPSEFGFWKSLDKPFQIKELWKLLREEYSSRTLACDI
jgi:PAS domain S-box-containing protein